MEPDFSFMALCETDFSSFAWASPQEAPEIMRLLIRSGRWS